MKHTNKVPPIVELNSKPIKLKASPKGGTWSGPGVIDNVFDPAVVGLGDFTLKYSGTYKEEVYEFDIPITVVNNITTSEKHTNFTYFGFNNKIQDIFLEWLIFIKTDAGYLPALETNRIAGCVFKLLKMDETCNIITFSAKNAVIATAKTGEVIYLYEFLKLLSQGENELLFWQELAIDITNDKTAGFTSLIYTELALVSVETIEDYLLIHYRYGEWFTE